MHGVSMCKVARTLIVEYVVISYVSLRQILSCMYSNMIVRLTVQYLVPVYSGYYLV